MQSHRISEVWDLEDDWSGVSSATERRRRQNRLNRRAARQLRFACSQFPTDTSTGNRKHAQRCATLIANHAPASIANQEANVVPASGNAIAMLSETQQPTAHDDTSLDWLVSLRSQSRAKILAFKQSLFINCSLSLQAPSDIQVLARLNVLNALASNAVALAISFQDLDRDECISPFNLSGPSPPGALMLPSSSSIVPECLRPTALQLSVVHHPWIDVFPIPGIRDNILRLQAASLIDEDDLCSALFAPDDTTDGAVAPLVVWGEPWEAGSWEVSPGFLRRWGCLVRGCPEVVEATNFWRERRGQRRVELVVD